MKRNGLTVLIGDDDLEVREYLGTAVDCHGYSSQMAEDGDEILKILADSDPIVDAILLDIAMPFRNGFDVLREIRKVHPNIPVIMVSGESSPQNVITAIRDGATDFLAKPVSHRQLADVLEKAIGDAGDAPHEKYEIRSAGRTGDFYFATSGSMAEVHKLVGKIGSSDVPVLINGETGTGKEVIAKQLHAQSTRSKRPFVKLNCAALPSELVESELFGYERGAFTGAFQRKIGMFELAHGGVIFLDEIGDMDFRLQAKLLQVLQDKQFQRLGGKEMTQVDVRVITATHRNLEDAIVERTFREDLLYRINVITISVPPLRERRDEILPLAEFFIRKLTLPGERLQVLTPGLKHALLNHDWPGNVRELENVIRRYLVMGDADALAGELQFKTRRRDRTLTPAATGTAQHSAGMLSTQELASVHQAKLQAETQVILKALNSTRWNRKESAKLLNLHYKALLYKMKKLGIEGTEPGEPSEAAAAAAGA